MNDVKSDTKFKIEMYYGIFCENVKNTNGRIFFRTTEFKQFTLQCICEFNYKRRDEDSIGHVFPECNVGIYFLSLLLKVEEREIAKNAKQCGAIIHQGTIAFHTREDANMFIQNYLEPIYMTVKLAG